MNFQWRRERAGGCEGSDLEGVGCAPGLQRRGPECWENKCSGSVIKIPGVFLLLMAVKWPIEVLRRWRKDRQEE